MRYITTRSRAAASGCAARSLPARPRPRRSARRRRRGSPARRQLPTRRSAAAAAWAAATGAAHQRRGSVLAAEPGFASLVDDAFAWLEDDHRRGANGEREFPYDAAIVTFQDLMRTDYPRYRDNLHRMQCASRRVRPPAASPPTALPPGTALSAAARADTAVVRNLGRAESSLEPSSARALQIASRRDVPRAYATAGAPQRRARQPHALAAQRT